MPDIARAGFAILFYAISVVVLLSVVIAFIIEKFKKESAKKKQEEAQKDAWENPRLRVPSVSSAPPVKKLKKPVDPDDIQISGPIPLTDDADVSQSKTQPIPVIGGGASETKIIQVQDHILESFYRKISDPKSYDWNSLPDDFRSQFGADTMPIFEAYVVYDTGKIGPGLTEMEYFMDPVGRRGKTYLETNVEIGGVLLASNGGCFVYKTTVVRFIGDAKKEDVKQVLEGGLYEYLDLCTRTRNIMSPLSSFVPLNPFDPDPKVFFLTHKDIVVHCHGGAHVSVRFPRGLVTAGTFDLKIELPGITVRPNYKRVKY